MCPDCVVVTERAEVAERALAEARGFYAEVQRLAAEVARERAGRSRGGADDCYIDNARSREREHRAIEGLLSHLAAIDSALVPDRAEVEAARVELRTRALAHKQVDRAQRALLRVVALGHNDDCIFCGLKDRTATDALAPAPPGEEKL